MQDEVRPGQIFQKYHELREALGGPKPPAYFRKRHRAIITTYLEWCAAQDVDAIAFLEFRFRAAAYSGNLPALDRLRSVKQAKLYRETWIQAEIRLDKHYAKIKNAMGPVEVQTMRSLKLLTHAMGAAKHGHVTRGRYDLCLADIDLTGGYHPQSSYCASCPLAVQCAAKLHEIYGFDVAAYREGRIGDLPKHIIALAVR